MRWHLDSVASICEIPRVVVGKHTGIPNGRSGLSTEPRTAPSCCSRVKVRFFWFRAPYDGSRVARPILINAFRFSSHPIYWQLKNRQPLIANI